MGKSLVLSPQLNGGIFFVILLCALCVLMPPLFILAEASTNPFCICKVTIKLNLAFSIPPHRLGDLSPSLRFPS